MRVLVVLLSVGFAGTERHAVELAGGLAQSEEVALVLREAPAEPHRQAEYAALLASIPPSLRVFPASRAMPWLGLWRAIRRFRPDVIHAHHERSARVATSCARLFGIPVAATLHIGWRRDFAPCDGLVALTPDELGRIPSDFPGVRRLIENWVVPHVSPGPARLAELRRELGIGADEYVVGSVGRLAPVKRMDGLIDAFARAGLPDARLVVIGAGEAREALEAQAAALGLAGRVRFTGFRADARDCFFLFSLFVLNSESEPYGLAILEAASSGVPVISTATAGARTIAANLAVTLVPIGDTGALAQALHAAWTRRHDPAPECRGFDFADRRPAILQFYRDVLERRRKAA